jgi:hypothetical protein
MPLTLQTGSEIASIIGVIIGLPTLWQAFRARAIAEQVKQKVDEVHTNLAKQTAVEGLSTLLNDLDEIKGLHSLNVWSILPRRYGAVRRHLIAMRIENPLLAIYSRKLQSVVQQLAELEQRVDESVAAARAPNDLAALNKVLSAQMDKINEVLALVRKTIGDTTT